MAPPLEYDKEPKAPDKSAATISNEDSKLQHSIVNDQQTNSDLKPANTAANPEVENNKQVVNLDDGQLRALLDEAMNYKCPKDLEGKSNLFKELFQEVQQDDQQDDQASSATTRGAGRAARRSAGANTGRGRSQLLQSNSLQDLVAALAAEPAPRRSRHHAPPPAPVSARATQGGSLPSGVDTSFLLSEEPRGAGYLATVRCVNPPPLAERRVSASDANGPAQSDQLHRRSKPVFPMTYTARATLEIGSGAVCSGRAVTTTTASNQVRTARPRLPRLPSPPEARIPPTCGPPERIFSAKKLYIPERNRKPQTGKLRPEKEITIPINNDPSEMASGDENLEMTDSNQKKLMNALCPRGGDASEPSVASRPNLSVDREGKEGNPRGPSVRFSGRSSEAQRPSPAKETKNRGRRDTLQLCDYDTEIWMNDVERWYDGISDYENQFYNMQKNTKNDYDINANARLTRTPAVEIQSPKKSNVMTTGPNIRVNNIASGKCIDDIHKKPMTNPSKGIAPILSANQIKYVPKKAKPKNLKGNLESIEETPYLHRVEDNLSDNESSDISSLRKNYCKKVIKDLVASNLASVNPRNIRNMTICKTSMIDISKAHQSSDVIQNYDNTESLKDTNTSCDINTFVNKDVMLKSTEQIIQDNSELSKATEKSETLIVSEKNELGCPNSPNACMEFEMGMLDHSSMKSDSHDDEIELEDLTSKTNPKDDAGSFLQYCADQSKLFQALQSTEANNISTSNNSNLEEFSKTDTQDIPDSETEHIPIIEKIKSEDQITCQTLSNTEENNNKIVQHDNNDEMVIQLNEKQQDQVSSDQYVLAELPNNAYVFLTLPKRLLIPLHNTEQRSLLQKHDLQTNSNAKTSPPDDNAVGKVLSKKKKDKHVGPSAQSKKRDEINKNALRVLLFENLKRDVSKPGTSIAGEEGDSAIPFSCITTPEVVASCNTTSSSAQSAIAVDPKPLQLGSGYRAVASLVGAAPEPRPAPSAPAPETTAVTQEDQARQLQVFVPRLGFQPRSVISSSFNGLPLSRPNYGATATSAPEEYKKSLDENGNAVHSSPVSGSSQHKKPRRKKSSKNETVIKSDQIDGYKGDKDLNEVLRFIESNAEHGRKLPRAKHDHDDKGKKRSTERRKDKENKLKRASSLEELSRTKLEDLTEPRASSPAAASASTPAPTTTVTNKSKPERRSWGDDAREPFYYRAPSPPELTDFQTVTKRRKPRRRADEPEREPPPRRPRPPEPRPRRESAPPSDRSNDSNDDLDSVHSLPADAPRPAPPHASYADIARTRHNIPDLIESCNFYAEGDGGAGDGRLPPTTTTDDYPALGLGPRPPRLKPPRRKERPPAPPDCPAPDVVADRRPPVILLDSTTHARDMDGVTFGFDINEQLLGGGARRRCDLVRDAIETQPATQGAVPSTAVPPATPVASVEGGVPVSGYVRVGGCVSLRYVPPAPPPDTRLLHQLVDYVGSAWEDVLRCSGGKVRYFSE